MAQGKKVAIVLSGCGVNDGAEIHESVLTMLALDRAGVEYFCFAPDIAQRKVVDHYHKAEVDEKRNVLVESARIARGDIQPLDSFAAADFAAVIFPGGFGAATTLCSFALDGADLTVNEDVKRVILAMRELGKPIGALCISPVLVAKVINGAEVTIGNNVDVAAAITAMGAAHKNAGLGEVVVDDKNRIVTTPCYMLDSRISEIYQGIEAMVAELIAMLP